MGSFGYIATIQIVIKPGVLDDDYYEGAASDWISGLLSDNADVLDWQYAEMPAGYRHTAQQIIVSDNYTEGDAFN